jgi:acetylornithine/N-succinyldiaminopimelate aminotransferase
MPDRDSNIGSSICPDMMTVAKGLGSGYPIGAVVMTEGVASTINGADLGSTFGGGPMAMAVLETSLRILREEKLSQHAAAIGNLVKESLVGVPLIEEVRGRGCLLGLKLNCSAKELQLKLLDRGILIGTSGDPSVARLLPPLVIKPEHVEMLVKAIREL